MSEFDGTDHRAMRAALRESGMGMVVEGIDVDTGDMHYATEVVLHLDAVHKTKPPCVVTISATGDGTDGDLRLTVKIEELERGEESEGWWLRDAPVAEEPKS